MGLKRAELPASDVKIYALVDPRDGRIRYIGKADDPARRLKTHLYESSARRTRKTGWIKSLRKAGLLPEIRVLEVVSIEDWRDAESAWIEYGLWSGWPLTNGTAGGDGGYVPASWSPEARAKRAATGLRNGTLGNGARAMTEARRGKPKPVGSGSKPGQRTTWGTTVGNAILTDEKVAWLRRERRAGRSLKDVAAELGVSSAVASYAATGVTWAHVTEPPVAKFVKQRLFADEVEEMRRLFGAGASQVQLARQYAVGPDHVSRIVRGISRRSK